MGFSGRAAAEMAPVNFAMFAFLFAYTSAADETKPVDKEQSKKMFDLLDTSGDGKLSKEEILTYYRATLEMPDDFWKNEDKNKDGVISWDEFSGPKGKAPPTVVITTAGAKSVSKGTDGDTTKNLFAELDTSQDGELSKEEIEKYHRGTLEISKDFWESQDKNMDGFLSLHELEGSKGDAPPMLTSGNELSGPSGNAPPTDEL